MKSFFKQRKIIEYYKLYLVFEYDNSNNTLHPSVWPGVVVQE